MPAERINEGIQPHGIGVQRALHPVVGMRRGAGGLHRARIKMRAGAGVHQARRARAA
ncbi:hypothetical protein D3C80_2071460 [compost metagenome]